ncbi:MAG: hypothetical protein VKN72_23065 [Nostocales cyanobacterium 94392]|nr:hypothetical protein [Nostocales cyanobacterium 94392]
MEAPVIAALITASASLFGTIVSIYTSLKAKKGNNYTSNQQKELYQSMTSLFDDNQKVLKIFAENINDSIHKQKIEDYINKLNQKSEALRNIFEKIPIWEEASNWLNLERDELEKKVIKDVLEREPSLANPGRELDSKEKQRKFKQSIHEYIDWILKCLNKKTTRINLPNDKLVLLNSNSPYKLAFECMKIIINKNDSFKPKNKLLRTIMQKNNKLSQPAKELLTTFIEDLLEKSSK